MYVILTGAFCVRTRSGDWMREGVPVVERRGCMSANSSTCICATRACMCYVMMYAPMYLLCLKSNQFVDSKRPTRPRFMMRASRAGPCFRASSISFSALATVAAQS